MIGVDIVIAASICYAVIGGVIGSIFAILFINFDKAWKKILSFLFGIGGIIITKLMQ